MTLYGLNRFDDWQKIPAFNNSATSIASGGAVVATDLGTRDGISVLYVRPMSGDDFLVLPIFLAGAAGLPANSYGFVTAAEVPTKATGNGPAGASCGPIPGSTQLYTGLPGFVWLDGNGTVMRESAGRTYWAIANGSWTDDGGKTTNGCTVDCTPCPDSTGQNAFSGISLRAIIPRNGLRRDPNIAAGNVVPWQIAIGTTGKIAVVIGCLDDPVGVVKIGEERQGWEVYDELDGKFPVGWVDEDEDFGTLGGSGGTETHDHETETDWIHGGDGSPAGTVEVVENTTENNVPPYRQMQFVERVH